MSTDTRESPHAVFVRQDLEFHAKRASSVGVPLGAALNIIRLAYAARPEPTHESPEYPYP